MTTNGQAEPWDNCFNDAARGVWKNRSNHIDNDELIDFTRIEPSLKQRSERRLRGFDICEEIRTLEPPEWLVQTLLVKGMPAVLGGMKKCLKTSILCDLAISLATATPFLGYFPVPRKVKVLFFSGESGRWTIVKTFENILSGRAIDPATDHVGVEVHYIMPRLSLVEDMEELAATITEYDAEVVILDPIYMALLSGKRGVDPKNVFEIGPLFYEIGNLISRFGAMPILCHHAVKRPESAISLSAPSLEDLAFVGIQEWCRQWILLGRREPFEKGTGIHELWMSTGGSVGFSKDYSVRIDEGILEADFSGKKWGVQVLAEGAVNIIDAKKRARDEKKMIEQNKQDTGDEAAILKALNSLDKERLTGHAACAAGQR